MNQSTRLTRENKSYTLKPYDSAWANNYEKLRMQISPLFGENLVDIQHIGSTAIPGMLAKPVIDVCVIVKSIDAVKSIRTEVEAIGFVAKGDYVGQNEEYFVYNDEGGERKYNVHTLQEGSPAIEGYLSFRDYLITFPHKAREYKAIKQELRAQYGENDYNSYDFKKAEQITGLKQAALAWYRTR